MAGISTATNVELAQRIVSSQFPPAFRKATIFYDFCQKGSVSPNNGAQMTFLSCPNIAVDVTALSETATNGNELSSYTFTSGTATLSNYGLQMPISELQAKTMTEGTLQSLSDEFGDWGGRTLDKLIYNTAVTTTNVFKVGTSGIEVHAAGAPTATVNHLSASGTLRAADIRVLRSFFKNAGVQGFQEFGGRWVLALHPDQVANLQGEPQGTTLLPTWASVNSHIPGTAGQNKILQGEGGALYGFEIKDSPTVVKISTDISGATTGPASVSGWQGLAFGKDAFVIAGMADMQPKVRIVKPMDTNDPLQLVWKIACKFKNGTAMIDGGRSIRVYSTA